ncbi:MAG: SCP2 sterol-binding domain-containing protein [Candidatus Schekmanbacteria bacterium]|nr:SCP2 sterol-binding domain-containing protein [Candidatus Schekmanbacteria bacterium]
MTLDELFQEMARRFDRQSFSTATSYYFTLGALPEQKWTVQLGPDGMSHRQGKHSDRADCVLKTSEELFRAMVLGSWMPGAADFMRGRLKTNDIGLLQRFGKSFARP